MRGPQPQRPCCFPAPCPTPRWPISKTSGLQGRRPATRCMWQSHRRRTRRHAPVFVRSTAGRVAGQGAHKGRGRHGAGCSSPRSSAVQSGLCVSMPCRAPPPCPPPPLAARWPCCPQICFERNTHGRSKEDIYALSAQFEPAPGFCTLLMLGRLLGKQGEAAANAAPAATAADAANGIAEVDMEEEASTPGAASGDGGGTNASPAVAIVTASADDGDGDAASPTVAAASRPAASRWAALEDDSGSSDEEPARRKQRKKAAGSGRGGSPAVDDWRELLAAGKAQLAGGAGGGSGGRATPRSILSKGSSGGSARRKGRRVRWPDEVCRVGVGWGRYPQCLACSGGAALAPTLAVTGIWAAACIAQRAGSGGGSLAPPLCSAGSACLRDACCAPRPRPRFVLPPPPAGTRRGGGGGRGGAGFPHRRRRHHRQGGPGDGAPGARPGAPAAAAGRQRRRGAAPRRQRRRRLCGCGEGGAPRRGRPLPSPSAQPRRGLSGPGRCGGERAPGMAWPTPPGSSTPGWALRGRRAAVAPARVQRCCTQPHRCPVPAVHRGPRPYLGGGSAPHRLCTPLAWQSSPPLMLGRWCLGCAQPGEARAPHAGAACAAKQAVGATRASCCTGVAMRQLATPALLPAGPTTQPGIASRQLPAVQSAACP